MAVIDLERLIGSKVAAAVAELNGDLDALIADAIDRELDRLVAQAVAERANGHHSPQDATRPSGWTDDLPTKTCTTCAQTKPVADFDRDRRVCRECRRDIARRRYAERQAAPVPFAGSEPPTSPQATDAPASPSSSAAN